VAEEKLREHGIIFEQFKTILTLGNSEAIALAVQEGIGVGFVSQMIISRLVEGKVAPVKIRGLDIKQEIYIGRDAHRMGTTTQTVFWNFVTDPENPVLRSLMASSAKNEDGISFANGRMNGKTTARA
jgi:DNA-binding transcriptional LysR family regulator